MKGSDSPSIIEFGGTFARFRLYVDDRRLYRLDQAIGEVPIRLGNPTLNLLCKLLDQGEKPASKEDLKNAAWGAKAKGDDWDFNLRVEINRLRTGLSENAHNSCIQTSSEGYAYVEPEKHVDPLPSVAPPRLSIIVLPFRDLSENKKYQYFADGIADDLTTDLSRLADTFVISRNTAFTYTDNPAGTKQIGRELGVQYVLEGSVRRSGDQVRVNAQLIDAETDVHLWADRFDHKIGDLFALQNEITGRIAVALDLKLVGAEAARATDHPDALDYILRGRHAIFSGPRTRDAYAEGVGFYERALTLDPRSVEAQGLLAYALVSRVLDDMTGCPAADIARAEELIGKALAASSRSRFAHFAKGQLLRAHHRYEEALPEYEGALSFNRHWIPAICNVGWCKFLTGDIDEGIRRHEQAISLSPRDPRIGNWYYRIGRMRLLQSRTDEAIGLFGKALSAAPAAPHAYVHAYLASAFALGGDIDRAAAELAQAQALNCSGLFSSIARLKAEGGYFGVPKIRALFEAIFFIGLGKAGMPLE